MITEVFSKLPMEMMSVMELKFKDSLEVAATGVVNGITISTCAD